MINNLDTAKILGIFKFNNRLSKCYPYFSENNGWSNITNILLSSLTVNSETWKYHINIKITPLYLNYCCFFHTHKTLAKLIPISFPSRSFCLSLSSPSSFMHVTHTHTHTTSQHPNGLFTLYIIPVFIHKLKNSKAHPNICVWT